MASKKELLALYSFRKNLKLNTNAKFKGSLPSCQKSYNKYFAIMYKLS